MYLKGFDSPSPLTWQELQAFAVMKRLELAEWEASALMKMSRSYCSWLSKASDPRIEPPLAPEDEEVIAAIQARNTELFKLQMAAGKMKPR
jgi:hypothetical protein